MLPHSTIPFKNFAIVCSKCLEVSPRASEVISFKCCGAKPSGPALEPFLKELMHLFASSTETVLLFRLSLSVGAAGKFESLCRSGCLLFSFSTISGVQSSTVASDDKILTAPFTSPIPSFDDTMLLITWPSVLECFDFFLLLLVFWLAFFLTSLCSAKSLICLFTTVANDLDFFPPLLGFDKHCLAKSNKCCQAVKLFFITTCSRTSVRALAAWILDALGTLFNTGPFLLIVTFPGEPVDETAEQHGPIQSPPIASICLVVNFTQVIWYHKLQFSQTIHFLDLVWLSSMPHFAQGTGPSTLEESMPLQYIVYSYTSSIIKYAICTEILVWWLCIQQHKILFK